MARVVLVVLAFLVFALPVRAGVDLKSAGVLGLTQACDGSNLTYTWGANEPLTPNLIFRPVQTIYIRNIIVRVTGSAAQSGYLQVYRDSDTSMMIGIDAPGTAQDAIQFSPDFYELATSDKLNFYVSCSGGGQRFVQAWVHFTYTP